MLTQDTNGNIEFIPDSDFTGERLLRLVLAVEDAVGTHRAGATMLGVAISEMCQEALRKCFHTDVAVRKALHSLGGVPG